MDAALGLAPIVVPYAMLLVLVAIYGSVGSSVLTLQELNIQAAAVMTLLLVAAGQTIVILLGGHLDLSVGGIVSLTTALAATRLGGHGIGVAAWLAAVVLLGPALGALNGLLVSHCVSSRSSSPSRRGRSGAASHCGSSRPREGRSPRS